MFFFLMIRRPPRSTLFPTRRSSDPHRPLELEQQPHRGGRHREPAPNLHPHRLDRKSTRLNSSHMSISYAVFCLKKKKIDRQPYMSALPANLVIFAVVTKTEVEALTR